MNSLTQIQGKIIRIEPAKTGYYLVIRERSSGKRQGAFSQWKLKEKTYVFTLRKDSKYFFIVGWRELAVNLDQEKPIHQPYEIQEKQVEGQLVQLLKAKIKQLETEAQQWKNAYHNQKLMLKKAQQTAQQRTVENRIKAIESKPGKKSKQDLDYLKLLTEFNRECKENWAWLNAD